MRTYTVNKEFHILGTVKGLVSEAREVEQYIRDFKPEILAVGISLEEYEGLKEYIKSGFELPELSTIEEIYADKLCVFGDVGFPPPAFEKSIAVALALGINTLTLDIPEHEFTDIYCQRVHTSDIILQSFMVKRLKKKKIVAACPEDFEIQWDALVNKFSGFKSVERAREKHMAMELKKIMDGKRRVLAIIEIARVSGVLNYLGINKEQMKS
jgi:pheromone shutdown protein TraB